MSTFGRMLLVIAVAVVWIVGGRDGAGATRARQAPDESSRIRVVHGIADAGPVDIYVDGALALFGIAFPETSTELWVPGGEHLLAIVPSGASQDVPIAAGAVEFVAGESAFVTLLGTATSATVGLFPVDVTPQDEGQSRFRVINGLADAGEVVPAFAGGESISATLGFGDASAYASVDQGVFDLEFIDAVTGGPLLSLPQAELTEGSAIDFILVGLVADGTLQAVVATTETPVSRPTGNAASIVPGRCGQLNEPALDIGLVRSGQGDRVGIADVPEMAQGFGVVPIAFETVIAEPHAILVVLNELAGSDILACGDIGGRLTETGALVISLQPVETGGPAGVAVIAPSIEDPAATGVSIFLEGTAAA